MRLGSEKSICMHSEARDGGRELESFIKDVAIRMINDVVPPETKQKQRNDPIC
jgi:hypothetical protein